MSEATPPQAEGHRRSGGTTVLVVDDVPGVRRLVVRVLERAGFRVLAAADAQQARALFQEHADSVDVLLTDVTMPGLSGPALAQQLARERPGLKVVFMSGYTAGSSPAESGFGPETHLIRKPFMPDELLQGIREALGGDTGPHAAGESAR